MGYEQQSRVYDLVYEARGKNYHGEATRVWEIAKAALGTTSKLDLLDVACGTGHHLQSWAAWFNHCEGLDLSEEMLAVARKRAGQIDFMANIIWNQGDMANFDLGRQFDVVTCLFSAIGHLTVLADLENALICMARHLKPGGLLMIEPWVFPENWVYGKVEAVFVDRPKVKVARMTYTEYDGEITRLFMHHMIGRPEGVETFFEKLELRTYSREQYEAAFAAAGLEVTFDPQGLSDKGRGLFIGTKPKD